MSMDQLDQLAKAQEPLLVSPEGVTALDARIRLA